MMTGKDTDALAAQLAALAAEAELLGHDVRTVAAPSPPAVDLKAAAAAALAAPTGTQPLRELAAGRHDVVVVTGDATRAVPSRTLLDALMPELAAAGVAEHEVTVVIATGAHRAATDAEVEQMLGARWSAALRVVSHDARADGLVDCGRTSRGTPVLIGPEVARADLRIALGVVEPHEFAGFSGGRKAILPGVAGYASILANHAPDRLTDPRTAAGSLSGNPVHEDMIEAVRMVGPVFILNVTLDEQLRATAVAAGDCEAAHAQLVAAVRDSVGVEADRVPDVIVTGPGSPLDHSLYQSVKALGAVGSLADVRTRVLLLAACDEGVGSNDMVRLFAAAGSPSAALQALRGPDYEVQYCGALVLADFLTRHGTVHAWCPGVEDETLEAFGVRPATSPSAGLAAALEGLGAGAHILFVPRPQRLLFHRVDASLHPTR